ncbi:MAG: hypothetical protein SCH71_16330 [Desulfobulbaceae bacterium]|nr:hypothetical protein [Desulfobulbaceae bacterium]
MVKFIREDRKGTKVRIDVWEKGVYDGQVKREKLNRPGDVNDSFLLFGREG